MGTANKYSRIYSLTHRLADFIFPDRHVHPLKSPLEQLICPTDSLHLIALPFFRGEQSLYV